MALFILLCQLVLNIFRVFSPLNLNNLFRKLFSISCWKTRLNKIREKIKFYGNGQLWKTRTKIRTAIWKTEKRQSYKKRFRNKIIHFRKNSTCIVQLARNAKYSARECFYAIHSNTEYASVHVLHNTFPKIIIFLNY